MPALVVAGQPEYNAIDGDGLGTERIEGWAQQREARRDASERQGNLAHAHALAVPVWIRAFISMTYPALLVLSNLLMLLLAGACGWWLVAPWTKQVPHASLIAPFAGVIVLPATTLLVYAVTGMAFVWSAAAATVALLTATALARPRPRLSRGDSLTLVIAVLTASFIVTPASFEVGEPAMLFLRGTDQAGYAQLASWLLHHTVNDAPVASSMRPLESWPAVMFASDPRFGSFAMLALVTLMRGGPTLFSYDPAQGLLLAAAVLAMGGAFAHGRLAGSLLGFALITGAWLDLGSAGYLGKLFGYPAALLLGGLLAGGDRCPPDQRLGYGAAVVLFTLAAAATYPGHVLALLAGAIGIAGTLCAAWHDKEVGWHRRFGIQLTLVTMIAAIFASGMVARPLQPGHPKWAGSWSDALAIAMGTQSSSLPNLLSDTLSRAGGVVCLAVGLVLAALASRNRRPVAFGLAAASAGLPVILLATGHTASLPQLVGFAGPALLGAATLLGAAAHTAVRRLLAVGMFTVLVATTAQTGIATTRALWPSRETKVYVLMQSELERLIAQLAGQEVILDVAKPVQWSLSFMLLAGERMKLSYSKASWDALFGYRDWPAPPESSTATIRIIAAASGFPSSNAFASTSQFMAVPSSLRPAPSDQLPDVLLRSDSAGVWEDGWMEKQATLALPAGKATRLTLVVDSPGTKSGGALMDTLSISVDDGTPMIRTLAAGENRISINLPESAAHRRVYLSFSNLHELAAPDRRKSAGRLLQLNIAP